MWKRKKNIACNAGMNIIGCVGHSEYVAHENVRMNNEKLQLSKQLVISKCPQLAYTWHIFFAIVTIKWQQILILFISL